MFHVGFGDLVFPILLFSQAQLVLSKPVEYLILIDLIRDAVVSLSAIFTSLGINWFSLGVL